MEHGISGLLDRFTPGGPIFNIYKMQKALVNAGVLNKANDGTLTFAKGGNLAE